MTLSIVRFRLVADLSASAARVLLATRLRRSAIGRTDLGAFGGLREVRSLARFS
jgi:hypothetical protein